MQTVPLTRIFIASAIILVGIGAGARWVGEAVSANTFGFLLWAPAGLLGLLAIGAGIALFWFSMAARIVATVALALGMPFPAFLLIGTAVDSCGIPRGCEWDTLAYSFAALAVLAFLIVAIWRAGPGTPPPLPSKERRDSGPPARRLQ